MLHLPLRYEDHPHLCPLSALKPGLTWQIEATIVSTEVQFRGRRQLMCLVEDVAHRQTSTGSGSSDAAFRAQLVLRFFHFYPNQQKALAAGKRVRAFGEVRDGSMGLEMVHPTFQVVEPGTPLPDRLTPVYPTTAGLAQDALRKLVRRALTSDLAYVAETLPPWTREPRRLWGFAQAVAYLHEPPTDASQDALDERTHPAWTRLKFDELIAQQLSLKMHRRARARRKAPRLRGDNTLTGALLSRLPFKLTRAQQRVGAEIRRDLARAEPMQRLLQGDVGSGKTIVAKRSPRCRRSRRAIRSHSWRRRKFSRNSTTGS